MAAVTIGLDHAVGGMTCPWAPSPTWSSCR